jgi:hypothetical protein
MYLGNMVVSTIYISLTIIDAIFDMSSDDGVALHWYVFFSPMLNSLPLIEI